MQNTKYTNASSARPMRSNTMKHIDALFNAMTCLSGFLGVKFIEAMLTAISVCYQRIQGLILNDPGHAISELKRASKVYMEYIRNPDNNDFIEPFVTTGFDQTNFTDMEQAKEALKLYPVLASVVSLRRILYGTYKFDTLINYDRVVFAILSIHRLIVLPPVLDTSSITNPGTGVIDNITDPELQTALLNLGITPELFKSILKEKSRNQQHYILSSSGPNGPATWTAFSDALALLADIPVFNSLRTYAEKTGVGRFINDLISVSASPGHDPAIGTPVYSGKIHTFEEWGGKTRHVAIVDYWTQLILTPLHDTLFQLLGRLTTDATFDQSAACDAIQKWTTNKDAVLYSFDLTAATDRLPADFQARVLTYLFSDGAISKAWVNMLKGREYRRMDYTMIRYAVGLPMGSKSNWAMLALCHHIIIQVAAMRAKCVTSGFSLSNPGSEASSDAAVIPANGVYSAYKVCGDDGVLHNTLVASKYQDIMLSLGLTINVFKSVLPGTAVASAAEFCKRIFIAGLELTTIPVKLVVKTTMNGRLLPQLQSEVLRRGMSLHSTGLISWLSALADAESFSFLLILNLLPKEITGLFGTTELPPAAPKLETMLHDTQLLKSEDYIQGYTYTAAVEELKRLDALLRTTDAVHQGITQHLLGYDQINLDDLGWETTDHNTSVLTQLKAMRHEIGYSHPVVQAAQAETTRVINLLAQLSAGSTSLSSMARLRLLDSFRNALVSAWADPQAARAQADRTLVQKTLGSLAELISSAILLTRAGKTAPATLNFTTLISYLSRLWTVRWPLGATVTINTVQSRVIASAITASTHASTLSGDIKVVKSIRSLIEHKITPSQKSPP